jgi:hypothetical protein
VRGIGEQQGAVEFARTPPLVPDDEQVHKRGRAKQDELAGGRRLRALPLHELGDRVAHELKAGDREKSDDGQRAECLELIVAVRMVFVGSERGDAHQRHCDQVVHRVERRLDRGAEH